MNTNLKNGTYVEIENGRIPDKIIDYKFKNGDMTIKHRFLGYNVDKEKDTVVGYIKEDFVFSYDTVNETNYLSFQENNSLFCTEIFEEKGFFRRCVGYIHVGENQYLGVTKSWFLLLFLFLLIGLCTFSITMTTLSSCLEKEEPSSQAPVENTTANIEDDYEEENVWDGTLPQNGEDLSGNVESTTFPGYANLCFSKENDILQLINPDENTVDFEYYLKLDGEVILSTKKIKPGHMKEVNLREVLNKGTYTLIFSISTYDTISKAPCNSVDQVVKVTIK